jgi:hypothetical protein
MVHDLLMSVSSGSVPPHCEITMLMLIGHGLLDPDGVHAHFRDDCPRVRHLHPGEMRPGFARRRIACPNCTDLAEREKLRPNARARRTAGRQRLEAV